MGQFVAHCLIIEKIKSHPGEMAKKIVNYSVSGHGVENEDVSFIVPKGVTVDFYVKYGEILPVADATKMWASLEKTAGDTYEDIGYPPVGTFSEGSICHNAWVDITDDFPSGLWKHDWPNPEAQSFAQNGSTGAYLSDIIAQIQKMEPNQEFKLHWISCREADKGSWWNILPNHQF